MMTANSTFNDDDDFELDGPNDPLRDPYKHLPPDEAVKRHAEDEERDAREQWLEQLADDAAEATKQ